MGQLSISFKSFLLATLIYVSTIAGFEPSYSYAIIFVIGFGYFFTDTMKKRIDNKDLILLSFIACSFILFALGLFINTSSDFQFIDKERSNDIIPFTIFLLGTIFFSKKIDDSVLKMLLIFIMLETIIALLEFLLGIPYLIKPSTSGETEFGETTLLYYNRVYGLSPNVSLIGQKVMIGIVLLFYLGEKYKIKKIFYLFLFMGLILTFSRSAILAIIVFLIYYFKKRIIKLSPKYKFLLLFSVVSVFFVVFYNINFILDQVFRGRSTIDISGRDKIFEIYKDFILEHVFFGNFVEKIYIYSSGHSYHAHNSYLQTLATLGVFLFLFFGIYLSRIITSRAFIFVLPFLIYSFSQYGLFWGCSMLDIVFYSLIFNLSVYKK
ncbi:O-antigen ligase family protein [Myroides odoratimimus]|uniref:O-antigen ligase family protein n=1 Tax=Myroides odoratimimus TaxID=76832 RepID=UPI002575889B|nr:O-antigen ligase family protein [Myroides odoratimimus]MDM1086232.1 O-antigen ligase family protein [Myroides odoratimimus]